MNAILVLSDSQASGEELTSSTRVIAPSCLGSLRETALQCAAEQGLPALQRGRPSPASEAVIGLCEPMTGLTQQAASRGP